MTNLSYAIISALIAFTITVLYNSRPTLKTRIAGWFIIRKCRRIANRYAEVAGLARAKLLILGGTFSLLLCLTGCITSKSSDGTTTKRLDPEAVAVINSAVIEALNHPAVSNAIFNATAPK